LSAREIVHTAAGGGLIPPQLSEQREHCPSPEIQELIGRGRAGSV
jgi:hypothetical protein